MRYSEAFNRDFKWYLSVRHILNFDGKDSYFFKRKGFIEPMYVYDKNGVNGKEAFRRIDSEGKTVKTKHPNIVKTLLRTKGSVNLHIKMYSEDRAAGVLPHGLFVDICRELNSPEWFYQAVENQKQKLYKKKI